MLKTHTEEADRTVVVDGYEYETPGVPWRATDVQVLPGYRLQVTFRDGVTGIVDLSERMKRNDCGVFRPLANPDVFAEVAIVFGVVTWANGVDLAPDAMHDELQRNGVWHLR